MDKNESYIYGLLITDGNLSLSSRNRGRIRLEVSEKDKDIVNKLMNIIPNSKKTKRIRNTNFKNKYSTVIFSNYRKEFRDKIIKQGFPIFDKTSLAAPPKEKYIESDFWRGVIDGDGSLGITSNKEPFISLVTKSEKLKNAFLYFLKVNFGLNKKLHRNKRDNCYNITIKNEEAILLIKKLYYRNCFGLDRKIKIANSLSDWKRTKKKRFK